jgi:hypothetical protein
MKTIRTVIAGMIIFIVAASPFTGCVDYAPVQDVHSEPDMLKGYIFGNIQMENYYELAVVLVIKNISTGKKIHVKFDTYSTRSRPREVSLISLAPGSYQITKMFACSARRSVFTFAAFDCTPERDFSCNGCSTFSKQFTVEKGKAHYIGDFRGMSFGIQGGDAIQWEISRADNNFPETTGKFRKLYSRFTAVPAVPAF